MQVNVCAYGYKIYKTYCYILVYTQLFKLML